MKLELRNESRTLVLYGRTVLLDLNRSVHAQVIGAIQQTWTVVGDEGLNTTGIHYAAYEADQVLFAGIELTLQPEQTQLTKREYSFAQYAYFKHIGSCRLLPDVHEEIRSDLTSAGHLFDFPIIEVYGQRNEDETKLETEIYYPLQSGARCPLCAQSNRCDLTADAGCWCMRETFPQAIFELVEDGKRGKACICKECLDKFKNC